MKKIKSILLSVFFLIALVTVDQVTKYLAYTHLKGHEPISIFGDVLNLTYLRNPGAAWGVLSGRQPFFIILTCVMILLLIYIFIKTPYEKKYRPLRIVMVGITAGAIGNLIDRIANGYVHDFIYIKIIDFPVFNVADMCVTISMVGLAILVIFIYKDGDFSYLSFKKKAKESEINHE